MIIRKGTALDMKGVLALIKELAIFEKEPEAVVITEEDLIRDGFGENPLFSVFVAEKEQEIVGIALYYYRYSTWKGKTIHLEDLVVKESMRGTGLGSARRWPQRGHRQRHALPPRSKRSTRCRKCRRSGNGSCCCCPDARRSGWWPKRHQR